MIKQYKIKNLHCANCAAKIERNLSKLNGVNSASVDFFGEKITIDAEENWFWENFEKIGKVCKKIEPRSEINLI